jgi:hypothetical protein
MPSSPAAFWGHRFGQIVLKLVHFGIALVLGLVLSAGSVPAKSGRRPEFRLPQTRARPLLEAERMYLGMRDIEFNLYTHTQGWEVLDQEERPRRGSASTLLLQPGGEALNGEDGTVVFAQGVFVRPFFEKARLVGIQLTPNFGEGGISLRQFQSLARAWFPDDRLVMRYQILPEDSTQKIVEAVIGRIPEAFRDLIGKTPIPFHPLVLNP